MIKRLIHLSSFIFLLLLYNNLHASISKSAFNDILTSNSTSFIQLKFIYNINTDYTEIVTTGSGTTSHSNALAMLETTANSNSSARISSKNRLRYEPGLGNVAIFTALFTPGITNSTQIIGIGNNDDGFFFGYNGTAFGILHRNLNFGTPAPNNDLWIPQNSWNRDKLDGNGPSGMILDPTKGNVYKIQYKWLGFGNIKFYIENTENGSFALVHAIEYSNFQTIASLQNSSLQLWAEAKNNLNNSNIKLQTSCMAAFTEGDLNCDIPLRHSIKTPQISLNATNLSNIITIHNKTTYHSQDNQIMITPDEISMMHVSGNDVIFTLFLNATFVGTPSYIDKDVNTSVIEHAINQDSPPNNFTVNPTTGKEIGSFYLQNDTVEFFNLFDYNIILNPGETLTLAAKTATTGSSKVRAAISWVERP